MNWKDIYKLPLHRAKYGSWVYDADSNFVFQFENRNKDLQDKILNTLNGVTDKKANFEVRHEHGFILIADMPIILIRGWGNLTGVGAHNLSADEAANIQDTFADWIVQQLTPN
jgi:hypothetical protein